MYRIRIYDFNYNTINRDEFDKLYFKSIKQAKYWFYNVSGIKEYKNYNIYKSFKKKR